MFISAAAAPLLDMVFKIQSMVSVNVFLDFSYVSGCDTDIKTGMKCKSYSPAQKYLKLIMLQN